MSSNESKAPQDLTTEYGMTKSSLALRREFIRLTDESAKLLEEKISWIEKVSDEFSKLFYDWQFVFGPTRDYLSAMSKKKGVSLQDIRTTLEGAQAGYIREVFQGSKESWSESYYNQRLKVGRIHAIIDLPMKWYLGSYTDMYRIVSELLERDFPGDERNPKIMAAVNRVFNYDSMAVCDAFLFEFCKQMGLSLDHLPHDMDTDKTEALHILKSDLETLQDQAKLIAEGSLDSPILEEEVPGVLGASFSSMKGKLIEVITQVSHAGTALAAAATELSASSEQMRNAIAEITKNAESASGVSGKALDETKTANEIIEQLGSSSQDIGEVVVAIKSITDQTKVLALNATIEAARAEGESGKGFAVVAQQVKELSNATASATADIAKTVDSIQTDAKSTVSGIREISVNIDQLSDVSSVILEAVKQQSLATENTVEAASELSRMAEELQETVGFFTVK